MASTGRTTPDSCRPPGPFLTITSDELRELELHLLRSFDVMNRVISYGRVHGGVGLDGAALDAEPWRSWMDSMALLAEWELPRPVGERAPEQRDGEPISNRFYEGRCLDYCSGGRALSAC